MSGTKNATGGSPSATEQARSMRRRWVVVALVAVTGFVVVAAIRTSTWRQLALLQDQYAASRAEAFYLGLQLRTRFERLNTIVLRQILSKADMDEARDFHQEAGTIRRLIERAKPLLSTPAERDSLKQVEQAFAEYAAAVQTLLDQGLKAVRRDSAAQVYQQIEQVAAPLLAACNQLIQAQNQSWSLFLAESQRTSESLEFLSHLSILLLLVLVLSLAALMYRALILPLRERLSASEAVVERQEKLVSLGTLAAGVAHEIRNPLTAIKFRLFSLKKTLPGDLRDGEDVQVIANEINRLERIVKDFLQFARPSEPELLEVTARQILQETSDLMRAQMGKRSIQLTLEAAETLWLKVDKQQLQQVLINLIQNAAESMDPGGAITLRAHRGSHRLAGNSSVAAILEVADTGRGIDPEVQKRLFDPFFSTKEGGTGLGLSISERIIQKHGGQLQYQTQKNRGTTFQIVLPCTLDHDGKNSTH